MRGKLMFLGGLAAGFVLGARAGREKYEELVMKGRQLLDHPTVQEAAGVAQAQANRLYSEGKDRLGQTKLGEMMNFGNGGKPMQGAEQGLPSSPASSSTGSSSSTPSSSSF
ncbi:MAG TPA: hypothetical protein VFX60_07225 [Micromonospora sp.]|nr:hypothetical protein [Micromonospora sp.]